MALRTVHGSQNIPPGAVRVTQTDALNHQRKLVNDWRTESEVFFLKYGNIIASALVYSTSLIITKHVGTQYKLKRGKLSFYLAVCIPPSVLVGWQYDKVVTNNVLLMKAPSCPMCMQLKCGICQTFNGVIYPSAIALTAGACLANITQSIYIPDASKDSRNLFKLFFKIIKAGALKLQILAAVHLLSAFALPYLQHKEIINISEILQKQYTGDSNEILSD